MPEGPEIHRQAQRLRFLEGARPLWQSEFYSVATMLPLIREQRVRSVQARGKAFLIGLESGLTLYAHMQLYGRWHFGRVGAPSQTNRPGAAQGQRGQEGRLAAEREVQRSKVERYANEIGVWAEKGHTPQQIFRRLHRQDPSFDGSIGAVKRFLKRLGAQRPRQG